MLENARDRKNQLLGRIQERQIADVEKKALQKEIDELKEKLKEATKEPVAKEKPVTE